ncbi:hypothetical protein ACFSTI_33165 [Rhizorhabdus histidinilytica]
MIGNLRRKPGALRNLVYREALFPDHAYRRAWQAFDAQLDGRQACRDAVALLDIAARGDCVDVLARRIDEASTAGACPMSMRSGTSSCQPQDRSAMSLSRHPICTATTA